MSAKHQRRAVPLWQLIFLLLFVNHICSVRRLYKAAFHYTDTDADILAILARMSVSVSMSLLWNAGFTDNRPKVLLIIAVLIAIIILV